VYPRTKKPKLPRFVQMSANGALNALVVYLQRAETANQPARRDNAIRNARVLAEALRHSLAPRQLSKVPVTPFATVGPASEEE
jgi:hypothetical protein